MRRLEMMPYRPQDAALWNAFVAASRNGTFLFDRRYMDYHADRFTDASLLVMDGQRPVAAIPANRDGDRLASHDGLTYGGVVIGDAMAAGQMLELFAALCDYWRRGGVHRIRYKPVPWIYHRVPSEEDRYALFRHGAVLVRCDLLTVVPPAGAPALAKGRAHVLKKLARSQAVTVTPSGDWAAMWTILTRRLDERYRVRPTHSLAEMTLLAGRFPDAIRLLLGWLGGEAVAGAVLYETPLVVHVQYMAANDAGRAAGALDAVIDRAARAAAGAGKWFDFGISTERDGHVLNGGLAAYKESFGGRGIVHEIYDLTVG